MAAKNMKNKLHLAVQRNVDVEDVQILLRMGHSIIEKDEDGLTPVDIALKLERKELLHIMLDTYDVTKVDIHNEDHTRPMFIAVEQAELGLMNEILFLPHVITFNITNSFGETLLHRAARCLKSFDHGRVIHFMLVGYTNTRSKDKEGLTPLHILVANYENFETFSLPEIFNDFFREATDFNSRDNLGKTPLHLVRLKKEYNCIPDLFRFGADINACDNDGLTLLDYIYNELEKKGCLGEFESREPIQFEWDVYGHVKDLIHQAIKLKTLKLHISDRVNERIEDLKDWFTFMNDRIPDSHANAIETFTQKCEIEIEKLKSQKLNGISLYDMFHKTHQQLWEVADIEAFQEYFEIKLFSNRDESIKLASKYPIFWTLLELHYNSGVMRRTLEPLVRNLWNSLPTKCLKLIMQYFTNSELLDFAEHILPIFNPETLFDKMIISLGEKIFSQLVFHKTPCKSPSRERF